MVIYETTSFVADAARLLRQEDGVDVGKNSTLSDGDVGQQLVELLVVPDGELKVTRVDPFLLVVTGSRISATRYSMTAAR